MLLLGIIIGFFLGRIVITTRRSPEEDEIVRQFMSGERKLGSRFRLDMHNERNCF